MFQQTAANIIKKLYHLKKCSLEPARIIHEYYICLQEIQLVGSNAGMELLVVPRYYVA